MRSWWQQVDRLLRGRETALGQTALDAVETPPLVAATLALAATYGFFMGWYAIFSRPEPEYRQVLACVVKVPALFLLTLFICFPSLYVFATLSGSRLRFSATLKLLLAIVAITLTVLASFGPIVAFFAVSTEHYPFMKLLNVAFFSLAGAFGVTVLLRALRLLLVPAPAAAAAELPTVPPVIAPPVCLDSTRQVNRVFRVWVLLYALVGCQMAWVLRPFLGSPGQPFSWFRARYANFFLDVWRTLGGLFG
jgi:hypothetical protein